MADRHRLTRSTFRRWTLWFFLSGTFFLFRISEPAILNYDEAYYVPAARVITQEFKDPNKEHPPLGKELIALGILILGDRPVGWRAMSVVFGALTIVGMDFLALALFENPVMAGWTAGLTLLNHLVYIHARIGLLDTFMTAFLVWALAFFAWCWHRDRSAKFLARALTASGLCFGLAAACKWFAWVPWIGCQFMLLSLQLLRYRRRRFPARAARNGREFFSPDLFRTLDRRTWVLGFSALPILIYGLTFVPVFIGEIGGLNFSGILARQVMMFRMQTAVIKAHIYMSTWPGWALMIRPIWYLHETNMGPEGRFSRGVLCLGNPFVMWGGLVALGYCFADWIKTRAAASFLIIVFYGMLYFSWAFIPRKVAYYYYYYPAALMLSLAWARCVFSVARNRPTLRKLPAWTMGMAVAFFAFFFPVISFWLFRTDCIRLWAWLQSWM
jgi:dolichyl-phosphate-mannose-protein mannosyltransferase